MTYAEEKKILDTIYWHFMYNYRIEWNEDGTELVITGKHNDIYISISAGGYLSVVVDQPFSKKSYYVFDTTTPKALEFISEELER